MSKAQNLVNSLIPVNSKSVKETRPKEAQKRDCDVSKRLANRRQTIQALLCKYVGGRKKEDKLFLSLFGFKRGRGDGHNK